MRKRTVLLLMIAFCFVVGEVAAEKSEEWLLPEWVISRGGPTPGDRVLLAHRPGDDNRIYLMFVRNDVRIIVDRELSSFFDVDPVVVEVRWEEVDRIKVFVGERVLIFRVSTLTWEESDSAKESSQ